MYRKRKKKTMRKIRIKIKTMIKKRKIPRIRMKTEEVSHRRKAAAMKAVEMKAAAMKAAVMKAVEPKRRMPEAEKNLLPNNSFAAEL